MALLHLDRFDAPVLGNKVEGHCLDTRTGQGKPKRSKIRPCHRPKSTARQVVFRLFQFFREYHRDLVEDFARKPPKQLTAALVTPFPLELQGLRRNPSSLNLQSSAISPLAQPDSPQRGAGRDTFLAP